MRARSGQPGGPLLRPAVIEGLCVLLALAALHPLLRPGYMWGHDTGAHMFRAAEVARALSEGVLYPRFLPDAYGGLGGPILNFNPVSPYYLPALLILLGAGPIAALKMAAGALFVAGGLAMRVLARPLVGRTGAAVAGLAWVYLPYRIGNLYVRMAFSELAVMVALPLAMAAARRAALRPTAKRLAVAGLLTGLLPALHFPGTVIGLPLVALHALVFSRKGSRARAHLALAAVAAIGLCASAFSWLPAIAEIGGTHYLDSTEGYDSYRNHFIEPAQLLSPRWGFGSSMPGMQDTMSFQIGLAHLAALAAALLAAALLPAERPVPRRRLALFCAGIALGASSLMLGTSQPLWDLLPVLQNVQFPWRLLMVVGVGTSLAAGLAGALPMGPGGEGVAAERPSSGRRARVRGGAGKGRGFADRLRAAAPVVAMVLLVGACLPYLQARRGEGTDADFTPEALRARYFGELKFQPIEVSTPRFRPEGPRAALGGGGEARIVEESTHRMRISASAQVPGTMRVHLFNAPGWIARVDGAPAPVRTEPGTGLVLVDLPAGAVEVELRYADTPLRLGAWILSGLTVAGAAIAIVLSRRIGKGRGPRR